MAYISGIANTQNSIEWMISELTYPDYQYSNFRLEVWTENDVLVTSQNWTSNTGQPYTLRVVSGLQPGQFYIAKAWIRYLQQPQEYVGSAVYSTREGTPTPTVPDSPSSITVTPSTAEEGRLYVSWGSATRATDYLVTLYDGSGGYIKDVATTNNDTTFNGLTAGGKYYVKVVPRNSYGNGSSITSITVTMPIIKVRPGNWSWDSTKSSGASLNITASEWNRFLNKIDAFRKDYKGLPGGSYTYASQGTRITAARYNQARSAIASMGAVPPAVSAGNKIYASEFNQIRDYLNAIT